MALNPNFVGPHLPREPVAALRIWAEARIAECRRQEAKFAGAWAESMRVKHQLGPPQALVEAWTERMTLQAVLLQLEGRD